MRQKDDKNTITNTKANKRQIPKKNIQEYLQILMQTKMWAQFRPSKNQSCGVLLFSLRQGFGTF